MPDRSDTLAGPRRVLLPIVGAIAAFVLTGPVFSAPAHARTAKTGLAAAPLPEGTKRYTLKVPQLGVMRYLAWQPSRRKGAARLPLIVMLHGLGGEPMSFFELGEMGYRLRRAIARGILPPCIAVMPEGRDGYWSNWKDGAHPYADLVTRHVLADARKRLPVRQTATHTALMGLSMGGFGALSIGLQHPEAYGVIIALSPTDMAYAVKAQPKRKTYTNVFGLPIDAAAVRRVNPYHLVRAGNGKGQRFLLSYGSREPRKFKQGTARLARAMKAARLKVAVQVVAGGRHGWASTWERSHPWWIAKLGDIWAAPAKKKRRR